VSKRSLWRLVITLLICSACGYFFIPKEKIRLGLDLKGGVHFELEVQGHEALEADLRDTKDKLQDRLREKGFPSAAVRVENNALRLEGIALDQKASLDKQLEYFGGYEAVYDATGVRLTQRVAHQKSLKDDANKRALQIIENRVNQFGVAEPEITASGAEGNRIVVELPGVSEAERERIKNLLSTPGRLEQRLKSKLDPSGYRGFPTREAALAQFGGILPPDTELVPEPETDRSLRQTNPGAPKAKAEERIRAWHLVESKVWVDGADIIDAHGAVNPQTDAHEINYTLNKRGADAFATVTGIASEEQRLMTILLDRKAVSVLSAREKIIGGAVRITGGFTKDEAEDLALKLKSGAMRASMKFLEERAMGPGLGADSINSGIRASIIGFGVVIAFMVLFYHWSGANAIIALTVNLIVMLGLMGSFRAVITLPGIAGFALTLGMAVDANILIFERIKEELAAGRSVPAAIQAGFDRVFWTIVDSHVTQLFAAMLLFYFGTGPVKGFAVTLTVGVTASLFTSIYISRFIYDWVLERHPDTKTLSVGTHGFFHNANFPFMKWKGTALAISWGIIVLCLISAQPWKGTAGRIKLGMQFTGGIDMTVRFKGDISQEAVRAALVKGGLPDASLVSYAAPDGFKDYSIKVKARENQDSKDSTAQIAKIREILRGLDPAAATDSRPDLNTEPAGVLIDQWTKTNPLALSGDELSIRQQYEAQVTRLTNLRGRNIISSYDQLPAEMPPVLKEQVKAQFRLGNLSIRNTESFSPSISGEWTWKTLKAVGWALVAILVYVMFRFTGSFAIGGIVALVHDILMAIGLFTLFGFEYSVPVVASFLILIGYSMADTIVVFDRIRENSHKPEYRRVSISKLVDDSINQTLSRTILTSCSVLFVAVCLFWFGGPALRDLSFPLVIGVITGTYSSIYIASPVVVYWEKWFPRHDSLKQKHS